MTSDEIIRSLYYNKNNESIITISVFHSNQYGSLKCRTTPIEYVRRNQLEDGYPLFANESLNWPGFVEFDDVNGKVLTYVAKDGIYKIYDLKDYSFLYSIPDNNLKEIKVSPGIMLLIFQRTATYIPLKLLSVEDGKELRSFNHLLHRTKMIKFIEQFNEKLLVKQETENLQIIDVRNFELVEVSKSKFLTPSAFIFLYEKNIFIGFRERVVAVWNFSGEMVTSFEDHSPWFSKLSTNNIYVTDDQQLLVSCCSCEHEVEDGDELPPVGTINISNVMTGRCVCKLCPNDPKLKINPREGNNRTEILSTISEAFEDVTALFYNEDRNEVITGNLLGYVHVWGS